MGADGSMEERKEERINEAAGNGSEAVPAKKKILRGVGALCFVVLLVLLLKYVYGVLAWKDTAGAYITQLDTFYELEEDVVDVLFLGSSHSYCSIIYADLWEEYGMAGYSLAISGQDLAASYYWLKEGLKTQSPKVVCLDLYYATAYGYGDDGNLYRNLLPYPFSADYKGLAESVISEDRSEEIAAKWPVIHTRYRELQKEDFVQNIPIYIGYQATFETMSLEEGYNDPQPYSEEKLVPIGEEEEKWLRKIIELAKENGLELVFFVSPYFPSETDQMKLYYAQKLAEAEGIPVINMIERFEELGFDRSTDFIDYGHTNVRGAKKVTGYLGKFLASQYDLPDHRGDPAYALWDRDALTRKHEMQNYSLQRESDLKAVLEFAAESEEYTVLIATSGEYLREDVYLADKLEALGICEAFYETGGVWIFGNGQILLEETNASFYRYGDWSGADTVLSGNGDAKAVTVNGINCIKAENGINIAFYDNLTGTVMTFGFNAEDGYSCIR